DRPEHRAAFVAKCAGLLRERVSVIIVDVVTTRTQNLYGELLALIGQSDPSLTRPPPLYATACRLTKREEEWMLETWPQSLSASWRRSGCGCAGRAGRFRCASPTPLLCPRSGKIAPNRAAGFWTPRGAGGRFFPASWRHSSYFDSFPRRNTTSIALVPAVEKV